MRNITLMLIFMSAFFISNAQNVGISVNGTPAKFSAGLDIDFPDKGLLIPRVGLLSTADITTITNPETSLLVYNTNASMTDGQVGFWYWDGLLWQQLKTGKAGEAGTAGWSPTGNAGLTAENFLGTTDAVPLSFYTNNNSRMTITANGNLGIGTPNPQRKVHILENDPGTPSMFVLDNINTTNGSGLNISFRGTTTGVSGKPFFEFASIRPRYYIHDHMTANSALTFFTANDGVIKETLKLTGQGYLGIGTTDPKNYLHVVSKDGKTDPVKIIGIKGGSDSNQVLTIDALGILKKKPAPSIKIITTSLTLDSSHYTIIIKAGGSIFLPEANSAKSRIYRIINQTATAATIGIYINFDGTNANSIPVHYKIEIQSDGISWYQVD